MNESRRSHDGGDIIVRANVAGTMLFIVTAIFAAALFTSGPQWIGAVTAMALFTAGIAAFVWSFWNAVQRSRGEQVAVTQLYMLAGGVAPSGVRKLMMSLLAMQIVAGLATALARPNNLDGSPGTSLALGVLVPMFGLGMNGLWAAFHGTYAARPTNKSRSSVTTSGGAIDKNEEHG